MTIQQLQYVLEISKTGSVSKAARNLFVSQPNISNAVKNLERELGIIIFERTPMGMQLTAAGDRLVQKAASITADIQEITMNLQEETRAGFRLVYPRYVLAFEAFTDLCRNYQAHSNLQFSCYIGDGVSQIEALYWNRCDLVVAMDTGLAEFRRMCLNMHVKYVPLIENQYYIQLSEHHPLLRQKEFDVAMLKDYPYVAFADLNDWTGPWTPWESLVNPKRLICVQSTSDRIRMVSQTNAYSIVLAHSEEYNRGHHVVQVPFDNSPLTVGYLYSSDRGLSVYAKEYIQLLKARLSFL